MNSQNSIRSDQWRKHLATWGNRLAANIEIAERGRARQATTKPGAHVVCAVEDFETIGEAVRQRLSKSFTVTYSCLWTQYENLGGDPAVEICPIFRSFHDKEPNDGYRLISVASCAGSVVPLRAMIVHMALEERFSRFHSIDVICPSAPRNALDSLRRELPDLLGPLVTWSNFVPYPVLDVSGYGSLLGGDTPSDLVGLGDPKDREYFTPAEIQRRIDLRPRRRRPPPTSDHDPQTPKF
ncbi:hypothetical protein CO662_21965 [Rhizobium anhuiense]|uniref:Uncharacterized protein n=1 Tax=Rhizobium anhuiense TaxID=1184720 RepID=A0ABX4J5P3_9HYPH|nr:hypothetical protein [Rhizobium anhuiense]PDS49741.1 hypothetical protein CO662_21965 [Rhizobium anhuiense]